MKVQINIPKRIIDLLVKSGVTSEKSQHNVLKTFVEEVLESGSMGLGVYRLNAVFKNFCEGNS